MSEKPKTCATCRWCGRFANTAKLGYCMARLAKPVRFDETCGKWEERKDNT